jgi:integrase
MDGKRREMGLGAASGPDVVTLADARAAASAANTLKRQGIDPLDHKKSKVEAIASLKGAAQRESNVPIFGVYADAYIDRHQSAWRNDKHIAQWKTSLTQHCQPLRHRRIDDIDTQAVMSVLQPLWTKVPETAQRLRGRIERVLDAAKVEGHRSGENPARWRGHLQALLPKRQKLTRGHHAALPFDRISELMRGLRERQTVSVRLLEFCILTATRSGEARNAQKSEFDLDRAVWTIPPHRMKTGREHRVPLSDRAVEILKEMGRMKTSPFLFPSAKGGSMSYMAMTSVLKRHGYGHVTVHGFRSTFRDWASETTSFPLEVCEMALAHAITN